jgi:hypothetical protein
VESFCPTPFTPLLAGVIPLGVHYQLVGTTLTKNTSKNILCVHYGLYSVPVFCLEVFDMLTPEAPKKIL